VRSEQEERLLPCRALAKGLEHASEMPQDATLSLQGRVCELEERIDVLMIVEAQPEQLVLPTPCVDRDGTHPQALRRLSGREQRTDLGLRLVAVPPSALKGGLPLCIGKVQLTSSRRCRTPQRLDQGSCLMQHSRNPGQVDRFWLGDCLSYGLLQALNSA
jgi:hypothetical protein